MILRYFSSLLFALAVTAADFDCKLTIDSDTYDLTKLKGEHTLTHKRDSPPTTFNDTLRFDLCEDLKKVDGTDEHDQCPAGTRACLTSTNQKKDQPDRVVAVIPLALASSSNVTHKVWTEDGKKGLILTFSAPSYPPSSSDTEPQILKVTITCATDDEKSEPSFDSYDGHQASVTWKSPAGCAFKGTDGDGKDGKEGDKNDGGGAQLPEEVGSGIGWFFLMLLIVLGAYFGIGAYYNYATYGARGLDLIPHRDFWSEVPYMMQDLLSHLCSVFRPRARKATTRGGYISV